MNDDLDDERAARRAVLDWEKARVAWFTHLLETQEPGAIERRLKALRQYHQAQVKRRKAELKR